MNCEYVSNVKPLAVRDDRCAGHSQDLQASKGSSQEHSLLLLPLSQGSMQRAIHRVSCRAGAFGSDWCTTTFRHWLTSSSLCVAQSP